MNNEELLLTTSSDQGKNSVLFCLFKGGLFVGRCESMCLLIATVLGNFQ